MIRTATVDGRTSVALEGSIGVDEVEPLQKALDGAVAKGALEVDLVQCRSLSSSAIGALIACHNTLRSKGGRLTVRGASDDMKRLLKLMGLDRHFELV
jgi:anti-sigma B factor antagonist